MNKIGIVAIAAVAALVLGFGIRATTPSAHAEVTDSRAVWCGFVFGIGGEDCTDGLTETEIVALDTELGDGDGTLEPAELDDIDLDLNQITDAGAGILDEILIFTFVDDDEVVTVDAPTGVTVQINIDTGGFSADADANAETCAAVDDKDCDNAIDDDGDGVVVATITDGAADAGDTLDVDLSQEGSVGSTETLNVVGAPDDIALTLVELVIETDTTGDCLADADAGDADQLGLAEATFGLAVVTDDDGVALTRIETDWATSDADVADIGDDTFWSVDGGSAGVAAFAVICGGDTTGTADITAEEQGSGTAEDATATITVVGPPETITLTASPASVVCDGAQSATVTAQVTDAAGSLVANGTNVNFSVVALGTSNPINVATDLGVASSTITPLSGTTAGVTVIVSAGEAQSSILVSCFSSPAATATAGGVIATPTAGGVIQPPDTGNGGYLGQDSSSGLSLWTMVALALGGIALVAGGALAKKVSK